MNFELNHHLAFSANMCGVLGRVSQQGRAWSVPVFPCFSQKVSCLVHHSMVIIKSSWEQTTDSMLWKLQTPNMFQWFVLVVSQTCNHAPKLTARPWLHSSFLKLKSFSETCKDLDQLEKRHVQISCWSLPSISSWRNHWSRKNLEKDAQQRSQEMTTRFLRTLDRACLNRRTFVTEPWIYPAA